MNGLAYSHNSMLLSHGLPLFVLDDHEIWENKTVGQISAGYSPPQEVERTYAGNIVDLTLKVGAHVKGLLERIDFKKGEIKIGEKWYSVIEFISKIDISRTDPATDETYLEVVH